MNDLTVIYVTSNRESTEFEKKTRDKLLANCGGLPIVSVSQKPIDLGENVCVGDVGASGFNFCRQVYMACEMAKTRFVVSAESDCLYPPDYFTFIPPRDDIPYRNSNIYIMPYRKTLFYKKESSTFAQVIGREFYLKTFEALFENEPLWSLKDKNFPKERGKKLFYKFEYFNTLNPCLSFKTGRGMRQHTTTDEVPVYELPYWGTAEAVRREYL